MPAKLPEKSNVLFDGFGARLFDRSILANTPLIQTLSNTKLIDFALYAAALYLKENNADLVVDVFKWWLSEQTTNIPQPPITTSAAPQQSTEPASTDEPKRYVDPVAKAQPTAQLHIQNNPWVDSVTIQTDTQFRTLFKFPNENRDIKRIYNPTTSIREDVTWIRELHTEQGKKSTEPIEIRVQYNEPTKDDPENKIQKKNEYDLLHRPSRDQSPWLILLWLYQHTPNVNQFAIVAVNMETMKFYDSLKAGTNSTIGQQYQTGQSRSYNDIISLPIEEAIDLINLIASKYSSEYSQSSSPHLAFDYTSRSNEFSWWNLDPDTPYTFRLPTPDELLIERMDSTPIQISNPRVLMYNKRVHPITWQLTNGHVLIEWEEKFLKELLNDLRDWQDPIDPLY